MVKSVTDFMNNPVQRELLNKLSEHAVSEPVVKAAAAREGPLSGQSFCVTGVLSRRREDVHAEIRAAGGEVHDRVKQGTTFLVAGEKVGKSKLDAARKYGAAVIDEQGLEKLLAAGPDSEIVNPS
jgi:DNA ligase (NAD+)